MVSQINGGAISLYQKPGSLGAANEPSGFTKEFVIAPGDVATLGAAVAFDNCPARYKDGYRSGANFIEANAVLADVDNTHSDNPADWITPAIVAAALPGVAFYSYPSRNDMKPKDGRTPRPKTHYVFPIEHVTDAVLYTAHMAWLIERLPCLHFDAQVKSPAQLNFGVESPEVAYNAGSIMLSDYIRAHGGLAKPVAINTGASAFAAKILNANTQKNAGSPTVIPIGERNSHLSHYAGRVLKRYGNVNGTAYKAFTNEAAKCSPPLSDAELGTIWQSAQSFYTQTVAADPNYVPPLQFNRRSSMSELPIVCQSAFSALCAPPAKARLFNIATARLFLQAWGLTLRLNEMSRRVDISGLLPKHGGEEAANTLGVYMADLANNLGYRRATTTNVFDALSVIGNENRYHPVIELLEAENWDGYDRRPEVFRMLGLTDTLHVTLLHKWCHQAVAVLYNAADNPIAAQGVLTLQGPQGIGKTELIRHLAIHDDFIKTGGQLDMSSKDSLMSALQVWICELGELDSTTKKEQAALKAFLTERTDRFREPYARKEIVRPRRTVFCGTVNPEGFLRDETGNRRYWTIPVTAIDLNAVFGYPSAWYAQFWRQILAEHRNCPQFYLLTQQEQDAVNGRNAEFETEVYGESEFLTMFNMSAMPALWKWQTAAHIANSLNAGFSGLNITSEAVGRRLLPRIEKRTGCVFEKKRSQGARLILCPPEFHEWWK